MIFRLFSTTYLACVSGLVRTCNMIRFLYQFFSFCRCSKKLVHLKEMTEEGGGDAAGALKFLIYFPFDFFFLWVLKEVGASQKDGGTGRRRRSWRAEKKCLFSFDFFFLVGARRSWCVLKRLRKRKVATPLARPKKSFIVLLNFFW